MQGSQSLGVRSPASGNKADEKKVLNGMDGMECFGEGVVHETEKFAHSRQGVGS